MAELQGLYFGMGIDTGQLNADFINAEKTINQNLRRINQEMEMIQLRGQLKLDGLDESASQLEKVRIQEEALTEQMKLQQDKVLFLSKTYEHLAQTRGENAEASRQVELQLKREQYAMQKLENQMENLSKQTETAFDFNWEMALGFIELATKGAEKFFNYRTSRGLSIPFGMTLPQLKIASAALGGITALAISSHEATEELRDENPAKVLDEDLQRLSGSIDNSWQKINDSTRRGTEQMRSYANRPYYSNNPYGRQNYYNGQYGNNGRFEKEQIEQLQKEQSLLKSIATEYLNIKELANGDLKILPDFNTDDLVSFARVMENYRFSESLLNIINLIKNSDSVIGKLAATLTGFAYLSARAQEPVIDFAKLAIDNFRELSKAANELNLSLGKTNDFMTTINLTGAQYEDVRDFVRGVQDAVIKGDSEDPEVLALEKYGVVIQDAQGKLLAFDETLERLYQGYLKAREADEAEAYIIMTNGQAVHDVLPYFEKLAQAREDMAKIKWSTLDSAKQAIT